jgi:aspartate racemase
MNASTTHPFGLIGGLGVGAAVHYYTRLAQAQAAQNAPLHLVMTHAHMPQVFSYVEAGDREGLARYLASLLQQLRDAGADFAAIPAVMPHLCFHELEAISPLPLLSIFEPLRAEITRRGIRRISVLGTRYVIASGLYGMLPEVEIVLPRPEETQYIHGTYSALAAQGIGTQDQFQNLTHLAQTLCTRESLDAIVLAGTDLSLIFTSENTNFPHLDCAALHIAAISNALLAD